MKLLTTLTLVLLAAIAAFAQKEPATKDVTFKDTQNRFSITYPPDWRSVPHDEGSQFKLRKRYGPYGEYESIIVVSVTYKESEQNVPRERNIEDIAKNLDKIVDGYRQDDPSAKMVIRARTRLAGRDAFVIEMLTTPKGARTGEKFVVRTFFTWESGYAYTVSLITDEHTFQQAFAEFERITSTFTIE
jgi:hypothetical protein